jgi:hypothetical protein
MQTKLQYQKMGGILAFHGYQAFAPGEATPEIAHAIGVKLAQKLWGDRFEVIVSTHLDKHHLHNHFVLNSVSFMDGKRYLDKNTTYALMRRVSDRLCREYSLSVIENPQRGKAKHYAEWKAEQEDKPTWRRLVREDVDEAIAAAMTFTQFLTALRKQGYEVKTGVKYLAVRPPGKERFVRLRSLGDEYDEEAIKQRILVNRAPPNRPCVLPEPKHIRGYMKGSIKTTRKITGLRALYIHYLYKMGILPRNRASPRRTHFLLREDIRYMDAIVAQTRLLCNHCIDTKDQLVAHKTEMENKLSGLQDARKAAYNLIRKCSDDALISDYKEQIADLSQQIRTHHKEVKLCSGILARSDEIRGKLHVANQEETKLRREEKTYEQRSRGGGPNRQHEPQRH